MMTREMTTNNAEVMNATLPFCIGLNNPPPYSGVIKMRTIDTGTHHRAKRNHVRYTSSRVQ